MAISLGNQIKTSEVKEPRSSNDLTGRMKLLALSLTKPVKSSELLFFTSQLSLMLEIETPLNLALKSISNQTGNKYFKKVLSGLFKEIEEGMQLSESMKHHPEVFTNVYSSMIKSGESGGFLKEILDRIVEMQEKRQALVTSLRSALTYPAVLCVVSVIVVIFILTTVLPKFTAFFIGKEEILPATTRILMSLSVILKNYWFGLSLLAIGLFAGTMLFKESRTGKRFIAWAIVNLPIISKLSNKIYTCAMLRTLGNLMESHVPLLEALEVTRGTISNFYFRDLIDTISAHVREGGKFSKPFSSYPYALDSVKQMIATGEETGSLQKVMLRLAEFYDEEVERELKILSSLIEPVALIVMGVVIGLIVSSVILPLFRLAQVMN